MLMKRIISTLLVVVTLLSSVLAISVSAADATQTTPEYEFNTGRDKPVSTDFYITGMYKGQKIDTPQKRINLMDLRLVKGDLELYVDAFSGEVAVKNTKTGETLFTNPYDATTQKKKQAIELLSQINIEYESLKSSGSTKGKYTSFQHAAMAGQEEIGTVPSQINVKYIPDGIRVEYSIGKVDSRLLVPDVIEKSVYYKNVVEVAIAAGCTKLEQQRLEGLMKEEKLYEAEPGKELSAAAQKMNEDKLKVWPQLQRIKEDGTVENVTLLLSAKMSSQEKRVLDGLIKKYCPDFSFEFLDNYYVSINYLKPTPEPTPLFNVALEYTLEENGFSVRLPANGIRFDESAFRLTNIDILPWLGATGLNKDGYVFYPDGTGALITFERFRNNTHSTPSNDIYDEDFGKSQLLPGHKHYEKIRYPVFGMKETITGENGENLDQGFIAIIENGDAMSAITTKAYKSSGAQYAQCYSKTNPRPYDTIKGDSSNSWVVVSERKYTGDYKIRYIMLSGENASYVGMAKAYREYLVKKGVLTSLATTGVKDAQNIPLYVEAFGAIETTKRFLSIPYKTNVAMTTFENVKTMYDELSANGVTNVNFILTGFAKGGLTNATMPYDVKWDGALDDEMNFKDLLADANGKYGVYPDFEFSFSANDEWFDGLSLDDHAVKTIDGRYTSKREYSATRQTVINYYELAISPAYFSHFYEHLAEDYSKLNPQGISISSLGQYLYSDFDEDEPYNREDSKQFIVDAFKYFKEEQKYSKVLTAGGNAFTWKYVDVITDMAFDSSSYKCSSATVPFLGIVLHGYMETATTPINMEGNVEYALLRAIENGTALKFMLSYDNTELLKEEYGTSVHYSVRYDIWLQTLLTYYEEINRALGDVQTQTIEEHKFITGGRVPDNDELIIDAEAALKALLEKEKVVAEEEKAAIRAQINSIRDMLYSYKDIIAGDWNDSYDSLKQTIDEAITTYQKAVADTIAKTAAYEAADKAYNAGKDGPNKKALQKARNDANSAKKKAERAEATALETLTTSYESYIAVVIARKTKITEIDKDEQYIAENFGILEQYNAFTPDIIAELQSIRTALSTKKAELSVAVTALDAEVLAYNTKIAAVYPEFVPIDATPAPAPSDDTQTDAVADTDADADADQDTESETAYSKYDIVESTVVYERYSGGKQLVLNFNNFDVKVNVGGKNYLIAAYSYIIL